VLYVDPNTGVIKLTRGDTAYLEVPLINELTKEDYVMQPEDTLTLSLKKNVKDAVACVQKTIKGTNCFKLLPEDTADCEFTNYKYDVQLTMANGDVFTVIEPTCFTIMPEVT
jgi:hypothetical protein